MQYEKPVPEPSPPEKTQEPQKDVVSLPSLPSFALSDENNIVDIEIQADHLLNYINKLTALADRACSTAIHQSESAGFETPCMTLAMISSILPDLRSGNTVFC